MTAVGPKPVAPLPEPGRRPLRPARVVLQAFLILTSAVWLFPILWTL